MTIITTIPGASIVEVIGWRPAPASLPHYFDHSAGQPMGAE